MEKTDWIYVIAIIVVVCLTVLAVTDKISGEQVIDTIVWIVTAIISLAGGFYFGKYKGLREAPGAD